MVCVTENIFLTCGLTLALCRAPFQGLKNIFRSKLTTSPFVHSPKTGFHPQRVYVGTPAPILCPLCLHLCFIKKQQRT